MRWIAVLGALLACSAAPPAVSVPSNTSGATAPRPSGADVPEFGHVAIEDGALVLMERNNGSERVNLMVVTRDCHGTKTSWADRPGPRTDARTAAFPIDDDECKQLHTWTEQLWQLAPAGKHTFSRPPPDGTPPFLWAAVVRRGAQIRVIDGGATSDPDQEPDFLEGVVDFLEMHF